MKETTFNEEVHKAAKEVADLVISKQRDYGPKNIMNSVVSPELSIAVRLNDKLARLANLVQQDTKPQNESLRDTALDIVGYGLILIMVIDGTFMSPLESPTKSTKKCPRCLGKGHLPAESFEGPHPTCIECGGSGSVDYYGT